jgi:sugar O-acyltransferase (sialic acid O-acetyltransferase NeuD family)
MPAPNVVVIYGCGGHGKVVADILLAAGRAVLGFLDDGRPAGNKVLGLPVLGDIGWIKGREVAVALGVGDNAQRRKLAERLESAGVTLISAVHPTAAVAASVRVEPGVVVMANAVVNAEARLGKGAIVNSGAVVEHDCDVGAFAHLSPNSALGGAARVGDGAHLGLGAMVLPGLSVGANAVVGAGAVVIHPVEPFHIAVGVPARSLNKRAGR